jgi:hypothetical protein
MGEVMTHTPGPWIAENGKVKAGGFEYLPTHDGAALTEWEANARLIAASPEMLAALKRILPWIPITSAAEGGASAGSENVRAADDVRAAIAKAEGTS